MNDRREVIEISERACELAGIYADRAIGESFEKFLSPEYVDMVTEYYCRRLLNDQQVPDFYKVMLRAKPGKGKIPCFVRSPAAYSDSKGNRYCVLQLCGTAPGNSGRRPTPPKPPLLH